MSKDSQEQFDREHTLLIRDRLLKIVQRVTGSDKFALQIHDLPVDRLHNVQVKDVIDLIGDLDLWEVSMLVEMASDNRVWIDRSPALAK